MPTVDNSGMVHSCRILCRYEMNDWNEVLNSRQNHEFLLKVEDNEDLVINVTLPLLTAPTRCEFQVIITYCCPDIGEVASAIKPVAIGKTMGK